MNRCGPHPHFVGKALGHESCGECGKRYADDKDYGRWPTSNPPESFWRDVWSVLVEECGARPIGSESYLWEQFIAYMNQDQNGSGDVWEFRFMGELGFGGKFHRSTSGRMRVDCYPSELNDRTRPMIDRANERLAELTKVMA